MKGSWTASKMESERNVLIGNCHDVKTWLGISKISYFGCLKFGGSLNKCFSNSIGCNKISIEKKNQVDLQTNWKLFIREHCAMKIFIGSTSLESV